MFIFYDFREKLTMKNRLYYACMIAAVCSIATSMVHHSVCRAVKFKTNLVKINACVAVVPMKQCAGTCVSIDRLPGEVTTKGGSRCDCCQPLKTRSKFFHFTCADSNGQPHHVRHRLHEPVICTCKKCRNLSMIKKEAMILM